MAIREILMLGNPLLYEVCAPVTEGELHEMRAVAKDLHDTLTDFRARYGVGRAIAAPQIGVKKRLLYMNTGQPIVFINPVLSARSRKKFELWDDCMSFPELLVRVSRHQTCRISYRDLDWQKQALLLQDSMSELLQHECDHLDGILAVARAIDSKSFALRSQCPSPRADSWKNPDNV